MIFRILYFTTGKWDIAIKRKNKNRNGKRKETALPPLCMNSNLPNWKGWQLLSTINDPGDAKIYVYQLR